MQPRPIAGSWRLCGPELLLGVARGAVVLFIASRTSPWGCLFHACASHSRSEERPRRPSRTPAAHGCLKRGGDHARRRRPGRAAVSISRCARPLLIRARDGLWIASGDNLGSATVCRINPDTGEVTATLALGPPTAIALVATTTSSAWSPDDTAWRRAPVINAAPGGPSGERLTWVWLASGRDS